MRTDFMLAECWGGLTLWHSADKHAHSVTHKAQGWSPGSVRSWRGSSELKSRCHSCRGRSWSPPPSVGGSQLPRVPASGSQSPFPWTPSSPTHNLQIWNKVLFSRSYSCLHIDIMVSSSVPLHLYVSCVLSLALFLLFVHLFLLFQNICFYFTIFDDFLDAHLYSNERERAGEEVGRTWEELGRGSHNQNILHGKNRKNNNIIKKQKQTPWI